VIEAAPIKHEAALISVEAASISELLTVHPWLAPAMCEFALHVCAYMCATYM